MENEKVGGHGHPHLSVRESGIAGFQYQTTSTPTAWGGASVGVADPSRAGPLFCCPLNGEDAITNERRVRVNRQIRISPVRVISPEGNQLGIMPIEEAMTLAEEEGLDLVEVAPNARPPVCRIMDYGKYKYEEARRQRQARKRQHQILVKEVKFRPGIEDHDFDFKVRHARRFLEEGNKVKATMMFRGRQMAHPELGRDVLARVAEAVDDVGRIESEPLLEGRNMTMILAPRK